MAHRVFRDSSGRLWDVWNVMPTRAERRQADALGIAVERRRRREPRAPVGPKWVNGWLAFQTRGEKRRLAPYPDDWADAGDDVLKQLCNLAVVFGAPRRLLE
jgi:hypothetical protein